MAEKPKQKEHPDEKKNILEWAVFFSSLLLIAGILGYLIYKTITYTPSSPDLVIEYKPDPSPHAPYRYHVSIKNLGKETAEEVHIELVLEKDGQSIELAAMEIPFSPKESSREGWVIFSKNPNLADTLYSRIISYKKP